MRFQPSTLYRSSTTYRNIKQGKKVNQPGLLYAQLHKMTLLNKRCFIQLRKGSDYAGRERVLSRTPKLALVPKKPRLRDVPPRKDRLRETRQLLGGSQVPGLRRPGWRARDTRRSVTRLAAAVGGGSRAQS